MKMYDIVGFICVSGESFFCDLHYNVDFALLTGINWLRGSILYEMRPVIVNMFIRINFWINPRSIISEINAWHFHASETKFRVINFGSNYEMVKYVFNYWKKKTEMFRLFFRFCNRSYKRIYNVNLAIVPYVTIAFRYSCYNSVDPRCQYRTTWRASESSIISYKLYKHIVFTM